MQSKRLDYNLAMLEAVLLAASVSFLSPVMLNPSRNSDRNKTSTRYKAIIQFWSHSIANEGKSNIDEKTCEPSNETFIPALVQVLSKVLCHISE